MAESGKEAAAAAAAAPEPGSGPPHEDEDALLARAHTVISRILDRELDPNPRLLHTLATMCELHEARSVLLCLTQSLSAPLSLSLSLSLSPPFIPLPSSLYISINLNSVLFL